jgi:hypothetical protein
MEYFFVFAIRLQDKTGSITAKVCGKFAEAFLGGGIPATDLYANNCSLDVVNRKLGKIMADGAQLDCVVVKHTHVDDPSRELFQVVETQIL